MLTASDWALPHCRAEEAVSALSAPCKSSDAKRETVRTQCQAGVLEGSEEDEICLANIMNKI